MGSENTFVSSNSSKTVFISDKLIDDSLNKLRFILIGRLDLVKLKLFVDEASLRGQWKLKGNCQFIPIGKGFFIIKLDNGEDMKLIYEGFWEVETQILRLKFWEREFKPELQKTSTAFVWVIFPGLCIEYWKEDILMAMGAAIGRPIRIDDATLKKEFGFYASILVEIDLAKAIPNKVWIESKFGKFEQEIKIPKLTKYCNHFKFIGHYVAECRNKRKEYVHNVHKPKQQWRYTPKKNTSLNTGGFDIFYTSQQIDNNIGEVELVTQVLSITGSNEDQNEKNEGFNGNLESPMEFPAISIDKIIDVGSSIPSLNNVVGVIPSSNLEASDEEVTAQLLSNINSEVGKVGEWKEVSDVVEKHDQAFSKIVSKPTKAEPKVKASRSIIKKLHLLGMSKMILHNSNGNLKGNIWLFWHSSVTTPSLISSSKQCITVQVGEVLVNGVHAECLTIDKRILWSELLTVNEMKLSWLVIGDFNVVLTCEEKKRRCGKRRILCDFDKAFYNLTWLEKFEGWCYKVGVRGTSDHGPLLGGVVNVSRPTNIPFKYQSVWTSHPSFLKLIQDSWWQVCEGNPAFCFMHKLKRLKNIPKQWNWEVFGDLELKVKNTEKEVLNAFLESDADPEKIDLLDKLVTARGKYEIASQQYNELMRAKSKVKWVKEGGANTNFFHTTMRMIRTFNHISELENDEDNLFTDVVPSKEEIKSVVFGMDANSAPGPDGFPGCFYIFDWDVIETELVEAVQYYSRSQESITIQTNWIGNFQLVQQGAFIGRLVSTQQGSFIKGRNIQEKIVLASELVNELEIKRRGGNVGLKIDITQAYDSLSWNFLFEVLRRFGFSEVGIQWLWNIFKSTRISVLINGGPCGFFEVGKGLRQGDPLSPILFVLAEEVLSINLTKLVQMGKIQAIVCRGGCQPTHLMFEDDIFIFCNGNKRTLENLLSLLMQYQMSSGQVVNKAKSKCFVSGVSDIRKNEIAEFLQMELSYFPDKYLGVILDPGRVKKN
ncbi:uncharacterized protein LOC113360313 [Papaver somniferum]|uniref:uncharacterized protein LOC113360313 n=1 Tax=Papaver somniferum TaxID=3469 RepID=UPI000E7030D7|nr:uncharacterized protein LOC113360313 [Papaver somniferum]